MYSALIYLYILENANFVIECFTVLLHSTIEFAKSHAFNGLFYII